MENKDIKLSQSPKFENRPEKTCRICYEPELEDDTIITPCDCNGSMKYIHEKCLKTWILSQTKQPSKYICDVCKYAVNMEINLKTHFSTKNIKQQLFKLIFLSLIICIVFIILIFLLITIASTGKNSVSTGGQIYLSIVLIVCFCIISLLLVILGKTIKSGCFEVVIVDWKIGSSNKKQDQDDITHLTELFDKRVEKVACARVEKYVIGLDDTQFMIRNPEVEELDSEIPIDHFQIYLSENCQMTPRLPNEVESI